MYKMFAIALLLWPAATSGSTCISRSLSSACPSDSLLWLFRGFVQGVNGNQGVEINPACRHGLDRVKQHLCRRPFEHVADRANLDKLAQIGSIFMNGERNHFAARMPRKKLLCHLYAIEPGHG